MSSSPVMEDCITISDDEDVELIEHVVNLEPVVIDLTDSDDSTQNDENSPSQQFSSQTRPNPFDIFSRNQTNDPLKTKSQTSPFVSQSQTQTKTSQQHSQSGSIFKSQTSHSQQTQSQTQPQFPTYSQSYSHPQSHTQPPVSNSWRPFYCSQQSQRQDQTTQSFGLFNGSQHQGTPANLNQNHTQSNQPTSLSQKTPPRSQPQHPTTCQPQSNYQPQPQPNHQPQPQPNHQPQPQSNQQPQPQPNHQPQSQTQQQCTASPSRTGSNNDQQTAPVAQQSTTNVAKPQMSDHELMVAQKALGNEKYKNNLFDDAIRIYRRVIELARKLGDKDMAATIHFNLAMTYYRLGSFDQAADECANAVKINDNYIKAHLKRGEIYQRQRKFDEAVICFEHCCELDSTNQDYLTLLNNARQAANRVKRKDYCQILGVPPVFSRDELRKAYRKKALIHHPDRHPDVDIVSRRIHEKYFKDAYEAFSLLDKSYGYR